MNPTYKEVQSVSEFVDAIRIRVGVFIIEQKCQPGWEPDEEDKKAKHFIAIVDKTIVSTARARETSPHEIKIERMATKKKYRRKGIGKGLIEYIIQEIKKLKPKRIWMESQVQAQGFYEQCGFKVTSKPYDFYNTGIKHVAMDL